MTPETTPVRVPLWRRIRVERLVWLACAGTLVALLLMSWSVLDPTPLPVMVSMSLGQVIGTFALGCYLLAVLLSQLQLRHERSAR